MGSWRCQAGGDYVLVMAPSCGGKESGAARCAQGGANSSSVKDASVMLARLLIRLRLVLVVGCGVLVVVAFGATATAQPASKLPVFIPFKFGQPGKINFSVTVRRFRNYQLELAVNFSESERANARKFVGGPTHSCKQESDCGEVSSFRVIVRHKNQTILDEALSAYGRFAHNPTRFRRMLISIPLRPGTYEFEVEPTEFGSNLATFATDLLFNTDFREADLGG